jgi:hypothetical protein
VSWFSRVLNAFRPERVTRDLDDENQFHLDARTADLTRRGMDPAQAREQARRQFGNPLVLRESSRDVKLWPRLESVLFDMVFGLRLCRKHATVTVAAVLSLSLAIGACTAAFSLIDALILRPLPVGNPAGSCLRSIASPRSPATATIQVRTDLEPRVARHCRNGAFRNGTGHAGRPGARSRWWGCRVSFHDRISL